MLSKATTPHHSIHILKGDLIFISLCYTTTESWEIYVGTECYYLITYLKLRIMPPFPSNLSFDGPRAMIKEMPEVHLLQLIIWELKFITPAFHFPNIKNQLWGWEEPQEGGDIVCVCVYIYIYIYDWMIGYILLYIYIHNLGTYIYTQPQEGGDIVCVCVYIYMYIYMYIYIHTT